MNLFTEVYDKSRELLKTKCFDDRWSNVEPKIKSLLVEGGFASADAEVLDLIRSRLHEAVKGKPKQSEAVADEIIALARPDATGFQDRAALLKTLKHIYFVCRAGGQNIWVVDHPRAHGKWIYDKAAGATKGALKTVLKEETETFGGGNRRMFTSALHLARKISLDVNIRLGKKEARTLRKVRQWFHDDTATDAEVKATIETLTDGFKKITALCNSNTVIFSDRPHKRVDPGFATTKASVNDGDKMPVIYVFKPFIKYGRINKDGIRGELWQCAKTIIHEMSHKILGTDDHQYGVNGIKPGVSITVANAIKNADSWGIFALDLTGYLPSKTAREAFS